MDINKKGLMCLAISSKITCSKLTKMYWAKIIKNKMSYSESELDSNFAINSVSDFDSSSESDSVMNLDICIFLLYIYTLLNKFADNFF